MPVFIKKSFQTICCITSIGTCCFNYIFLEAENDPANDPVILWYNGGPGAASRFGRFVERGPNYLTQDSYDDPKYNETGIPQVQRNPYGWTKIGNVIAVNNPPPIGFSYCDAGSLPCASNDTSTAEDAFDALLAFFTRFPALQKRPFFITGESYAGICEGEIPTVGIVVLPDPRWWALFRLPDAGGAESPASTIGLKPATRRARRPPRVPR